MNADLTFITNEPPAFELSYGEAMPAFADLRFAEGFGKARASAVGSTKSAGKEANLLDRFKVLTCT